jgi:hypothetical protein
MLVKGRIRYTRLQIDVVRHALLALRPPRRHPSSSVGARDYSYRGKHAGRAR